MQEMTPFGKNTTQTQPAIPPSPIILKYIEPACPSVVSWEFSFWLGGQNNWPLHDAVSMINVYSGSDKAIYIIVYNLSDF